MTNELIKKEIVGVLEIELLNRINPTKFPLHKYAVKTVKNTPNGKYAKQKQIEHFVYKTFEEAEIRFNKNVQSHSDFLKRKTDEKELSKLKNEAVKACDFYSIGDIVVNTWGWEQTNVDYYLVIKISNKTIEVKEIKQKMVDDSMYSHGMACEVLPDKDNFNINGDTYKLRVYADGRLSNPERYYYMRKWSGKAEYKSWYA